MRPNNCRVKKLVHSTERQGSPVKIWVHARQLQEIPLRNCLLLPFLFFFPTSFRKFCISGPEQGMDFNLFFPNPFPSASHVSFVDCSNRHHRHLAYNNRTLAASLRESHCGLTPSLLPRCSLPTNSRPAAVMDQRLGIGNTRPLQSSKRARPRK